MFERDSIPLSRSDCQKAKGQNVDLYYFDFFTLEKAEQKGLNQR